MIGNGLLALLNDYRGPPRYIIAMYAEKIRELMNDFENEA